MPPELIIEAVVAGLLLGCFYAAVSLGLSVSFGLLDVPHVAHPAFLVVASYAVFVLNEHYGIDPLLAGLLITPLLFLFGLYYRLVPQAGASALATVQGWLHIVGAIVFPIGVAIVIGKGDSMVAVPIIGSLVVVIAVVLFAAIVFRTTRA